MPEDSTFLNFDELIITPLSDLNLQPPLPHSDKQTAVFNLPVLRRFEESADRVRQFNIQRLTDSTLGVRYVLSAQELDNVVNLKRELETSVDTFGSATINLHDETLGLVGVASTAQDTSPEFAEIFIESDDDDGRARLDYKIPWENDEGNVLFIYSNYAANRENSHSKLVDAHLLYKLSNRPSSIQTHKYTDRDFNIPIMRGQRMALEVNGNHYLLGYNPNKPWTGVEFFEQDEIRLERVGGIESIQREYLVGEDTMRFTLGNDYVVIVQFDSKTDLENKVVKFSYEAPDNNIISFVPELEYETELPQQSLTDIRNVLKVGDGDKYYENCDSSDYRGESSVMLLCEYNNARDVVDQTDGDRLEINSPEQRRITSGLHVLVLFREIFGSSKVVTFQWIIDTLNAPGGNFADDAVDWSEFRDNLIEGKNPVIEVDNDYYELGGSNFFEDLFMRNIDTDDEFPLIRYHDQAGEHEGMIAINEHLFTFDLNDNQGEFEVEIGRAEFLLVTNVGFEIGSESGQSFITRVDENLYDPTPRSYDDIFSITTIPQRAGSDIWAVRAEVRDENLKLLFSGIVPLRVEKSVLLTNGDQIKLWVYDQVNEAGDALEVKVRISQ
jgi:hypothetical protein